jgi:hypothetical protein
MDKYNRELADTVNQMFGSHRRDPSADEIAEVHFGGKAVGGEVIDGIRKRLPKISRLIEQNYEHLVCVVSETYYARFRNEPPQTDADARKCIPVGQGVRSMGIRLSAGENDLIYQSALRQGLATGGAKFKKGVDRTVEATTAGRVPRKRAARLLKEAQTIVAPKRPKELGKIMQELPAKQ